MYVYVHVHRISKYIYSQARAIITMFIDNISKLYLCYQIYYHIKGLTSTWQAPPTHCGLAQCSWSLYQNWWWGRWDLHVASNPTTFHWCLLSHVLCPVLLWPQQLTLLTFVLLLPLPTQFTSLLLSGLNGLICIIIIMSPNLLQDLPAKRPQCLIIRRYSNL